MILVVQDKLVSSEILKEYFVCKLEACKGACCWEGDYGAPLEKRELEILDSIYLDVKPYLSEEGVQQLETHGLYTFTEEAQEYSTTLLENGACAYLTFTPEGNAFCGIEKAYEAGVISFKKPISCHLYPIRVKEDKDIGFESINYDKWDICSAACQKGKELNVPVYQFAKDALIRKYGEDFYNELDEISQQWDDDLL